MVNAGMSSTHPYSRSRYEGIAPLRPPNCLDRLKNKLAAIVNNTMNMATLFYYVSNNAIAVENICKRMDWIKLGSLIKTVGNITHCCATVVFSLRNFRVMRRLTAMGDQNQGEQDRRVFENNFISMIKIGKFFTLILNSRLPELGNGIMNGGHPEISGDRLLRATQVSELCKEIIEVAEKISSEYKATVCFVKVLKKIMDSYIQIITIKNNLYSELKYLASTVKVFFGYAVSLIHIYLTSPILFVLRNAAQTIFTLLSYLCAATRRF